VANQRRAPAAAVLVSTFLVRIKTMAVRPFTAAVVIAAAVGIAPPLRKVAAVVFGCVIGMVVSLAMFKVWLIARPTEEKGT
jgi:hypothetical protein